MDAAKDLSVGFHAMPDYAAIAVRTKRRQREDCALEAIEGVTLSGDDHFKRLVIFILADFAFGLSKEEIAFGSVFRCCPSGFGANAVVGEAVSFPYRYSSFVKSGAHACRAAVSLTPRLSEVPFALIDAGTALAVYFALRGGKPPKRFLMVCVSLTPR